MKIKEILKNTYKDEIPFILYDGKNGYKINCLKCDFYNLNNKNYWQCTSMFLNACRDEYFQWLEEEKK